MGDHMSILIVARIRAMSTTTLLSGVICALTSLPATVLADPTVLQVGTYRGHPGSYSSVQAAVDAASPGDWILIAPGVYHETGAPDSGVRISKAGLHLRGMNRNGVVIDGTLPGFGACSADPAAQRLGAGRNGIEVFGVDGVSIENLTVCNFLSGAGGGGNQVWWNGGDGSGVIGMGSYHGAYLTASTTFYSDSNNASYGIFVSNAKGPGVIERSYASNMSDSSFYVGACPDCNAVLREVHAQNSPQGFSGTNAGGHLVLELSEWDHNRVGIASTTLANDDRPSPQDGACPGQPGKSCTLIQANYVHDNNTANTPAQGIAATVPIGTGILISGGRNDTVFANLVVNNGAWGVVINDYPDGSLPHCDGGSLFFNPPLPYDQILGSVIPCYFHAFGNRVAANFFLGNGSFGNESNGDLANAALDNPVNNCFANNFDLKSGQPTSAPANLQDKAVAGTCGATWTPDLAAEVGLFLQLLCDTYGQGSGACQPADNYPVQTGVSLLAIPREAGMRDPCEGVPSNSWCAVKRN
jgi:hypothetical protein